MTPLNSIQNLKSPFTYNLNSSMSAASALAGWTNHESGGQGEGNFFAAFPGVQTQNPYPPAFPSPFQNPQAWPTSPFSSYSPMDNGGLFAHHQGYAMNSMGVNHFGNHHHWEGPSTAPGPAFGGFGMNHPHGFAAQNADVSSGGWFGAEGHQKLHKLGLNSPRHRTSLLDDDEEWERAGSWDDEPWDQEDWHHRDETDWDLLDDFDDLALNHKPRRRSRSHSFSEPYSSPVSTSSFYQLSNLSSVSHNSPKNRSFLSLGRGDEAYRPRPLNWRSGYSVRPTLLSKIPLLRSHSVVDDFSDPIRRTLHPYLQSSSMIPALVMDLRMNPRYPAQSIEARRLNKLLSRGGAFAMVQFLNLPHSPQLSRLQLSQPACTPPVDRMRLYHPRLPWYIDVVQTRPGYTGVTVGDVITQVWKSLQTQVRQEEYYCAEMDDENQSFDKQWKSGVYGPGYVTKRYGSTRSFVGRGWSERCMLVGMLEGDGLSPEKRAAGHYGKREKAEMAKGIRRVDWLGAEGSVTWIGLTRGKGGLWEIKTQNMVWVS